MTAAIRKGMKTMRKTMLLEFFQLKSYNAGVRCCENDGSTCYTYLQCGDNYMTYDNAALHCAENGGRLCTKVELLNDICCGTGGSCDNYAVWTSTSEAGKVFTQKN